MEDLVQEIVDFLRLDPGAATVQALLGANYENNVTADFDPANVCRPTVFVLLPHNPNKYNALGNTTRVENPIVSILCFTDTRAESVALLNALESVLITNASFGNPISPNEDSFDPDTLLFLGISPEMTVNNIGYLAYTRELTFARRDNGGLGWNGLWNPASNTFQSIVSGPDDKGAGGGKPPYVEGDFSTLFKITRS